ncbi:MAG: ATP-binding protein [bacterium]
MMDSSEPVKRFENPFWGLASFRTVAILVGGLVLVWVGMSVNDHFQTRQQLRELLRRQAEGMAATLALADQQLTLSLDRLEEEQETRLLTVGWWLKDLDAEGGLTADKLKRFADNVDVFAEGDIFNINVFDTEGRHEFGLRGPRPFAAGERMVRGAGQRPRGGGMGRGARLGPGGMMGSERFRDHILDFLDSDEEYAIQRLPAGRGPGVLSFGRGRLRKPRGLLLSSAIVRRNNGGAILVLLNTDEQEQLRREMGPAALMQKLSERSGVAYLVRRRDNQTDLSFGDIPPQYSPDSSSISEEGPSKQTFEIETDVPGQEATSLIVGFDPEPLRAAERKLFHRLLLSAGLAALLGTIGLLWTRLSRHHGFLTQALEQVRSYHRVLLERMDDAVLAWSENEGLTFWNRRAERLFPNLSAGDPPPIVVVESAEKVRDSGGQRVLTIEEPGLGVRRFRTICEVMDSPIRTHLLFLTDVTAVEQATIERNHREHLEALARVASGVAHEVRNPLNAIDMTIQTLCAEPSTLQSDDRKTMDGLRREIGRINGIIEHFLAYGRPQPPMFADLDLSGVVSDVAALLSRLAKEKGIELTVETEDTGLVKADAQQVRQALLNVTLNALEASEPGSCVSIRVQQSDEGVECVCRDEGAGMTAEQVDHLFDPYVTTKPGGTGLGMSIVQRILQSHHGWISVKSELGSGTEIVLRFPKEPPVGEEDNPS